MTNKWLLLCMILVGTELKAQENIPLGTWRTHYSFRDSHSVSSNGIGLFTAGTNSLFFLDNEDLSLTKLGKIDGLSDTNIASIGYHENSNTLVIAYINGNIDLLADNKVFNLSTLLSAPIGASKRTRDITFNDNLAYLATDFGVVVVDLTKSEIQEAYTNIGTQGEMTAILAADVFKDSLYLTTPEGLISGALNPGNNLQDYSNWYRFGSTDGLPTEGVSNIGSSTNHLFASVDSDGIYIKQGKDWVRLDFDLSYPVLDMTSAAEVLAVTTSNSVITINDNLAVTESISEIYPKPQSTELVGEALMIADSVNGLITSAPDMNTSVFPNGPFSDSISSVHFLNDVLFALPGGYDNSGNPLRSNLGFYAFQEGSWVNYNATGLLETELFPEVKDLVDVTYNLNNNNYYFASFGEGIIEWSPGNEVRILDESTPGSSLQNILPPGRNVLVSCVLADQEGNIWAGNYGNQSPLHKYDPEVGSWSSFQTIFPAGRYPLRLELLEHGDFWLQLDPAQGGGILVINPKTSDQKHLTNQQDQGGLPSRIVNDLVVDRTGQVWIATQNGVSHFPFPADILQSSSINASPVLIDGRPLLNEEPVTCLAVDGGNRKWIGTEKGIWLFSPQGDSVISNFTVDNSPLPSNAILDVDIDHNSGEVFMVTDAGTISYRSSATEPLSSRGQVKIFPNPVDRDFQGMVGISGLAGNDIVKVTDITGKLVKEFMASGGTAVWDIRDYQGQRVQSGVYLIFSSSPDGDESFVGKIAVVN